MSTSTNTDAVSISVSQESPLVDLIAAANGFFQEMSSRTHSALWSARELGRVLSLLQDRRPKRGWSTWRSANFPKLHFRKDEDCRHLYRYWHFVEAEFQLDPEMSISGALKLIRAATESSRSRPSSGASSSPSSLRYNPPRPWAALTDDVKREGLAADGPDKFLSYAPADWPAVLSELLSDRVVRVDGRHKTVHDRELDRLLRRHLAFVARGDDVSREAIQARIAVANHINRAAIELSALQTRIDAADAAGNRRTPLKQGEPIRILLPPADGDQASAPGM